MQTNTWYFPLVNDFKGWTIKAYLWLVVALLVVGYGSLYSSPLEFVAALTNVLCVILVAKGKVSNYYWGAIGVVSYAIVAYSQQLYGNMLLNIIYIAYQAWGYVEWRASLGGRIETTDQEVIGKRLTQKGTYYVIAVLVIGTGIAGIYLNHVGSSSPILDAFTLVGSLVAMTLMVKRYAEQWILWVLVNIASIWMWVIPSIGGVGSWAMVAMWSVFLINSLYGTYKWFIVKIDK